MEVLLRTPNVRWKGKILCFERGTVLPSDPRARHRAAPCWEAGLAFPFSLCQLVWSRKPTNGAESQALLVLRARRGEVGRQRPWTEEQCRDSETVAVTAGAVECLSLQERNEPRRLACVRAVMLWMGSWTTSASKWGLVRNANYWALPHGGHLHQKICNFRNLSGESDELSRRRITVVEGVRVMLSHDWSIAAEGQNTDYVLFRGRW